MARVPDPRQRNPFVAFNNFGTQVPMTAPGGVQFGNAPMQQGNSEGPNLPNTMPFPGGGTMAPGGNPWPDGNGMPMPNLPPMNGGTPWPDGNGMPMPNLPPMNPGNQPPNPPHQPPRQWTNQVNYSPIEWMPPEYRDLQGPERAEWARQWREGLGNAADAETYATNWGELGQIMQNGMLAFQNPLDAQATMDALATSGAPQFQEAYGNLSAGFDLGMGPGARADAYYNSSGRFADAQNYWDNQLDELFGGQAGVTDPSGWEGDETTDPLEQADNWMQEVFQAGQDLGYDDGQTRRNRYQQNQYNTRLAQLQASAQSMGIDPRIVSMGMGLLNPSQYSRAQSPVAYAGGRYGSAPATANGGNANYGYRNQRYT